MAESNPARIYIVSGPTEQVLVRANSQAQAIRAVVSSMYTAKPATASQVVAMMTDAEDSRVLRANASDAVESSLAVDVS